MRLPRLQLFEFNDSPWAPKALRDTLVEALGGALERGRILDGLVRPFQRLLDEAGTREVLDLGSGSGAPARILVEAFRASGRAPPRVLLSDLNPQPRLWESARARCPEAIDFIHTPVDATRLPARLTEGRVATVINMLHHLPPARAREVLAEICRRSRGLFVAECFERNPLRFAAFAGPGLPSLARTPLAAGPQRLARVLMTWASPVSLAVSVWDGVASTLRIHEIDDLWRMTAGISGWSFGSGYFRHGRLGKGFYFWGLPRAKIGESRW